MASDPEALLRLARDEFANGRLARSRELCDELLGRVPDHPEGLHLLALLELSNGNAAAALGPIERALRKDRRDAKKHQTRGLILRAHARRAEAAGAFQEALRLSPEFPEAHASLALTQMEEGEFGEAAREFERALHLRPDVYPWRLNLGLCRSHSDDAPGAADAFQRAVQLNDRLPEGHNNLGTALLATGRLAEAESSFRRCIALAPQHSHAWTNLGNVLRRSGRPRDAEEAYRRATECQPPVAVAWVNLGNALKDADRVDEAMACFARAMTISPESPEAHLSRAIACLLAGDLDRGWAEYRWRFGSPAEPGLRERVEEAIRARRTIEIRGEQGLGDALFFLRWAPLLRGAGATLAFRGDARLVPLLERSGVFDRCVGEESACDGAVDLPSGDLPWVARGIGTPHPPALPLKASAAHQEAARGLLEAAGPPPYIGVAWGAGLASGGSAEHLHKMVPVEALGSALRHVPGTIVSLQRGADAAELAALSRLVARPVLDAGDLNADLDAILGLLTLLDDYAGVSSTNIHMLAGLGRPARILVPAPPEWRYGRAGSASPWFTGFELYRQDREREWAGAMKALASDLGRRHGAR